MSAYYNEFDPKAAAWLRQLIMGGYIAPGVVDERSITEVKPGELMGYTQCHFFAGIGGWSYALRLAGWADTERVWTGSCPCQPFSIANSRRKAVDHRDLFGVWAELIRECKPSVIFGEQVASPLGLAWLDTVSTDLENEDYAVGAADLCAAGVGAPHIRQRLYWVALGDAGGAGSGRNGGAVSGTQTEAQWRVRGEPYFTCPAGEPSILGDSHGARSQGRGIPRNRAHQLFTRPAGMAGGTAFTPWDHPDYVHCTDGKARPIESGTFPLADGFPERVGLLRGYGNAIVPQLAAQFIQAVMS